MDDEITALSTIRDIINRFISRLKESINQDIKLNLLDDTALLEAVDALTMQKIPLKEEKKVADLESANEKLNKLTDRNVRIIYLPSATVAAAHYICNGPEDPSSDMMHEFIEKAKLWDNYPAVRCFAKGETPLETPARRSRAKNRRLSPPNKITVTMNAVIFYFSVSLFNL